MARRKSVAFQQWLAKTHPKMQVLGLHYDVEKKRHEVLLGCRVALPTNVKVTPEDEDKHAEVGSDRVHLLLPGIH